MVFRTSRILTGAALLLAAPAAFAQDASQTAQPAAPAAPAEQAATGASAGAAATVSDAEIKQFATAALAVDKVRKDAAVPEADKNTKMVEAISASGLQPARFNEIAQAMQADPALNKRIQEAAASAK
ncbi:MAG: DUF4168 domain-containing protein [Sphingomonas sp.]|uniref:DUF4168 domain-containing protein n=1 Tax=Sphingomonas sp. TaxID=28214 RepID=UPI001B252395|nr:DUF4168 domain-containing protein [Sphingomonas sp.]MBO9621478.1 DUF4168 domain-containing protein [Sphingomonas sp.]